VTDLLTQFQQFMDARTGLSVIYALPLALLLMPVGIFVHEVGHVLVARRNGATVRALVVAPEGPSVTVRVAGVPICLGLGLKRDLRSREAMGWVDLRSDRLTARQAIAIFAAGPAAETAYWILVVLTGVLAPAPTIVRIVLIAGVFNLANAVANLFTRKEGSDGQMIRHLRTAPADAQVRFGEPATNPAAVAAEDSVAPPGYVRP
jgi:membrane-associated protease RseP (regulator of RpoE activity)